MLGRRGLASSGLGYGEMAGCEHGNESKSFIYQQMHFMSVLDNIKIYIKIYIKTAPTCFWSTTIIREFTHDLINVTLSRLVCKLSDDGSRPKHVGAVLI
jgi:hypothetical protein